MNSSHSALIRLIAVFKLIKAACLIVVGIGMLKLIHADVGAQLDHWVASLGFDPGSRLLNHAIEKATNIPPGKIKEMGVGSFVYAVLFLTEGIGLWLMKRWAEWFTVFITGSLIPLEVYEIYRHPSPIKIAVLIINIAVLGYLIYRITHDTRAARAPAIGKPLPEHSGRI